MNRCERCKYAEEVIATLNWSFAGCHYKPYKGEWVAEIKDCPKVCTLRLERELNDR